MPGPGRAFSGIHTIGYVAIAALLCGCHARTATTNAPSVVPTHLADSKFRRVSPLLDFETPTDTLFVTAEPNPPRLDTAHAHTGRSAILLPKGTTRLSIKLSSLVSGRDFPGTWTLAGLHLFTTRPADCTLSITAGPATLCTRTLKPAANHWTPILLDLGPLRGPVAPHADDDLRLVLTFPTPLPADAWCDDVLLADNARTFVDPSEGLDGHGWTVRREGFHWVIDRPQRFHIVLAAEEEAGGWTLDEANRIRARFHSTTAAPTTAPAFSRRPLGGASSPTTTKSLTVYSDGRSYWDSSYKPLSPLDDPALFAPQHLHPASLRIPEDQGRPDRNTPGDANHDGYNESTGAYTLVAAGRRLKLTIDPGPVPVLRPVFEIRNLPPGDVLATLEGALAADTLRLPDGRVLIIAPGLIQRRATLDVRVR